MGLASRGLCGGTHWRTGLPRSRRHRRRNTPLPGTGRARTARCTALPGWGRRMCTDASPSKNTHLGVLCALWHLWFDLVKRSESELGEELLMVTELGDGRERNPARILSCPLCTLPEPTGQIRFHLQPPAGRRVWRTVDSRCSVDADWTRRRCVRSTRPGALTRLQVPLTLTVPACVSRRAQAVAAANVEKAVVPAAHATRVPGDLCSDGKETLGRPPLGRPGRCLPGCWARASGTACHPPLHHRIRPAGEGTYHRAPLRDPRL